MTGQINERYELVGAHLPTGEMIGFCLPLFKSSVDNATYLQILDGADRVTAFEVLEQDFAIHPAREDRALGVGELALHAFALNDEPIIGTRTELSPALLPILGRDTLFRHPLLYLELATFCDARERLTNATKRAFQFLADISLRSAETWRDVLLSSRIHTQFRRTLYETMPAAKADALPWASARARLTPGRLDIMVDQSLADALPAMHWKSDLYVELNEYLCAFGAQDWDLNLTIRPSDRQVKRDTIPRQPKFEDTRRVLFSLGKRSQTAAAAIGRHPELGVHVADFIAGAGGQYSDAVLNFELQQARKTLDRFRSQSKSVVPALVVFDGNEYASRMALQLLAEFKDYSATVVCLHSREHDASVWEIAEQLRRFDGAKIFIADSRLPTSSTGKISTSSGWLLNLVRELNGREIWMELGGEFLAFTSSRAMTGINGAVDAFQNAISISANSAYSILDAKSLLITIASVGRPESAVDFITTELRNMEGRRGLPKLETDFTWRQRRFLSGGVIPTQINVLSREVVFTERSWAEGLLSAAADLLIDNGFTHTTRYVDGEPAFEFEGPEDRTFLVAATRKSALADTPSRYINLVGSRKEQRRRLQIRSGEVPLLYTDLYTACQAADVLFAAELVAILNAPKASLAGLLTDLLQDDLEQQISTGESGAEFRNQIDGLAPYTKIEEIFPTVETVERPAQGVAAISGGVIASVNLFYDREGPPAEKRRVFGSFEGTIGINGLELESVSYVPDDDPQYPS